MSASVEAEFEVPDRETRGSAPWFWDLAEWRGVYDARLTGYGLGRQNACLTVRASKRAMRRVRNFCTRRGYREVRA